jgi:hypothetical protein
MVARRLRFPAGIDRRSAPGIDPTTVTVQAEYKALVALGAFQGIDGEYNPHASRQEAWGARKVHARRV